MKKTMRQINWGMIGCGNVTEKKSAPAFNKVPNSHLLAVTNRTPDKAKSYAERFAVPRWYSTAEELLADSEVNAIYIATPPDSHLTYTLRAAEAGKPVYVEKPMARTYQECLQMIKACEKANVPLFVAYYRRYLPKFLKVKQLLAQKAIGEPRFVSVRLTSPPKQGDTNKENLPWRVIPKIAGGGHFYDLAPHQLDILDFFFGKIIKAVGFSTNQAHLYPAEDLVTGTYVFESGILGNGVWCFTTSEKGIKDEILIEGSKGNIRFATFDGEPVMLENENGKQFFAEETPENIQLYLIQAIVDELFGGEKCTSTGISGARTNWVLEQLNQRI
jgi:predicted dehydrogenase